MENNRLIACLSALAALGLVIASPASRGATFFDWDVVPTVTTTISDRTGCLPHFIECYASGPIKTTHSRIHGGTYGVDWDGDGVRDGILTADVELISEVMSNEGGTYDYYWRITNLGTGNVTGFRGGNPAGFAISSATPLASGASQVRFVGGTAHPPRSEAWGIVLNPSSGFIGTIAAPTPSTIFDWDLVPSATASPYERVGCLAGTDPCTAPRLITGLSCRIAGTYGVDYTGDGVRDGTMTADVRIVSEVRSEADGTFTYWWQIANDGSGPITGYVGANTPQFAISGAVPLGTIPLVTTMTSPFPPGSEAWGIIVNPSSGAICSLLKPVADTAGPVITSLALVPNLIPIGALSSVIATADDSSTGALAVAAMQVRVGAGDWTPMAASDGAFDGRQESGMAAVTQSVATIAEVCVRAVDLAGNTGQPQCALLVAYDPSAGFATGGGWIDSPPGACKWDATLTGKAAFGFVSRYAKGASAPTGNTQFTFNAGDLNFHSGAYEWMVVGGGGKVQFKGVGSVNGIGEFGFMIFATDGEATHGVGAADRFRIKIWDKGDGDAVVYDNGVEQIVSGGGVIVHTGRK